MGAALFGTKTKDVLKAGDHGSTFGGNPVCAAGALSIMRRLTPELLAQVREKGEYLRQELAGAAGVKEFSGLGLMAGVLPANRPAKEIAAEAIREGLIVLTAKDKVPCFPL